MDKTIDLFMRKFSNKFSKALRPLTSDERDRLLSSIKRRGIIYTILVDEEDNVLDGWNRLEIASELFLAEVPLRVIHGLSEQEKSILAMSLNAARRQLSPSELDDLIASVLKKDPTKSSRKIAEETKAAPGKVEEVRKDLEAKEEIPIVEERKAADGAKVTEKKPVRKKDKPAGPATETTGDVTTVPQHLADAFQEAKRLEVMATACRGAANWFKTSVQPWNKWATIAELVDLYTRLGKLIEDCTPHAVCPKCKGYACKECRMTGWVPAWKEEELEHEAKGKRT